MKKYFAIVRVGGEQQIFRGTEEEINLVLQATGARMLSQGNSREEAVSNAGPLWAR
jgi:hypothetical protein